MKNKVEISLEEYKELLLGNTVRNIDVILLERIIDYIKENCKVDKESYSSYKVDGIRFDPPSYWEKEILTMIKYVDGIRFLDIYKYTTDKDYKQKIDDLKMEKLRAIKDIKKGMKTDE